MRKAILLRFVCCCAVYLANSTLSFAQEPPPQTLTLDAAVELAEGNYPAIRVAKAQAQAASEQIGLAQTAYLPRPDLLWQENRASTNNIFGRPYRKSDPAFKSLHLELGLKIRYSCSIDSISGC